MTLTPVKPETIKCLHPKYSHWKAVRIIEEFVDSEHEAVELCWEPGEYSGLASAQSTYARAAKRIHANVHVISRSGKLYLLKGDVAHVARD